MLEEVKSLMELAVFLTRLEELLSASDVEERTQDHLVVWHLIGRLKAERVNEERAVSYLRRKISVKVRAPTGFFTYVDMLRHIELETLL